MSKKKKSKGWKRHSTPALPPPHEAGSPFTLVEVRGDQVVTSSLLVAQKFGKEHRNIIRNIRDLLANKDVLEIEHMFYETLIPDAYGRMQPAFAMNRDGFSLLVMGFTGKEALRFKVDFIAAFSKMEAALKERKPDDLLTVEQREELEALRRESVKLEKFRHKDSLSMLNLEVGALQDKFHKKMHDELLKMFSQTGNAALAIQSELYGKIAELVEERLASVSK
jgi:Rha family phage regulatory protein